MSENIDLDNAVVIALGSDLPGEYPDSRALLEAALEAFPAAGLTVRARTRWWRSAAWPDPAAPAYTNGVALVETSLSPLAVMAELLRIEVAFGRVRGEPNAPRTLDLDLIAHGRRVIDQPGLTLPHPRAQDRLFVMGPLAEIAPAWRHPLSGETAGALARAATVAPDARPIV